MSMQDTTNRESAELPDIYATPILELVRRLQVTYQIDWGKDPGTLEIGAGQWHELANVLMRDDYLRRCLDVGPPMLWGMDVIVVPNASGLMVK